MFAPYLEMIGVSLVSLGIVLPKRGIVLDIAELSIIFGILSVATVPILFFGKSEEPDTGFLVATALIDLLGLFILYRTEKKARELTK